METTKTNPADFIKPLVINGLKGRVLKIPTQAKSAKAEILLVYGSHSSIERMFNIAFSVAKSGRVTLPDLPGFGGMDSFYKVAKKPDLDTLADYLATFIKLEYKKRPIVICAMSLGFAVATRMLQKYPEISNQTQMLVSFVGFTSHEDFKFKKRNRNLLILMSQVFRHRLPAAFLKHVILRGPVITAAYSLVSDRHVKMIDANAKERKRRIKFEINLWKCNDVRTYMDTMLTMMKLDITKERVNLPVIHVIVKADQYFDNTKVKSHLKEIFTEVEVCRAKSKSHAPTVISNVKDVEDFIPKDIRRRLKTI